LLPPICFFSRLPACFGELHKLRILKIVVKELQGNDINNIAGLPSLVIFSLYVRTALTGTVIFSTMSFPALKYFRFTCGVTCLAFQEGAMHRLQRLKLCFNAHGGKNHSRVIDGIEYLLNLQEVSGQIGVLPGGDESNMRVVKLSFEDTIRKHPRCLRFNLQLVDFIEEEYPPLVKLHQRQQDEYEIEENDSADGNTKHTDGRYGFNRFIFSNSSLVDLEADFQAQSRSTSNDLPIPYNKQLDWRKAVNHIRYKRLSRSCLTFLVSNKLLGVEQSFALWEERNELLGVHEHGDTHHISGIDEYNEVEDGVVAVEGEPKELRIGEALEGLTETSCLSMTTLEGFTGTSSLSMASDDDTSNTTMEEMFISPDRQLKRKIKSWMRGAFLGSGSLGMVYEAISQEGVFFAVKEVSLLDQGSKAQQSILALEKKIELLSQLQHENIVHYYGTEKGESKLYIFVELVTQGSLSSLYKKYKLQESQVCWYTSQILNGLVYLHKQNVVHGDIRCANILVHANESPKLADFGLAKEMSNILTLRSCERNVYWMAPEFINPKKTFGPAADIWSLGCVVLEMLTRQIPYPNVKWTKALYMIGKGEQPPIPNYLSEEAQDFICQCVRVDPETRPSATQLLEHPFVNRQSNLLSSLRVDDRLDQMPIGAIRKNVKKT